MEFTFNFNWRDHVAYPSFRKDKAEVTSKSTTRVCFSGVIGTEEQKPAELHSDVSSDSKQDFGQRMFASDSNGRLKGRAVITTIGVYPYRKKDGSIEWELRHPDDVYDYDSLKTLELLPLTNDHPDEMVTKDNIQGLQVGHLGEFVMVDTMHGFVTNAVVVSEAGAVTDVQAGKRALSAGYNCDVIPESGTWGGIPYTARQKNIRYNHVSIVDRGRAGDDAVMKFDSYEGIQTDKKMDITVVKTGINTDEEVTMGGESMKTVKVDGVEYQAEPAVITALHKATLKNDEAEKLTLELDTLKKDKAAIEGERDSLKEKNDALQKQLDSSIKLDQLEGLFAKRQKLDEAGVLAKIEDFEKLDANGKMEAVVLKVSPGAKESLDARKDTNEYPVYLESRFDSAVEQLKNDSDMLTRNIALGEGNATDSREDDSTNVIKTDEDNWKQLVNASKKGA